YVNDDGVRTVTKTSHDLMSLASYPISVHEEIENGLSQNDPYILDMFVGGDISRTSDNPQEALVGNILSVNTSGGYGFIKYPNNNLYFNSQDVLTDFNDLAPGDTVTFNIERNPNNQQDIAKNISKI
ncbi:MAG: cold shock domain-containing protein, partial [Rikenellaceae bacterium]|nr:cold shock domain-containing protein [Rikenellaceae bacterium]